MTNIFTFRKKIRFLSLLLFAMMAGKGIIYAQFPASSYSFTALAGTFTEITGTAFTGVQQDDVLPTTTIPIGFTFNFCGVDYTTIRASSNGYMSFTAAAASTAGNALTGLPTIKQSLFWLWDDLDGATGTAQYTVSGTQPNRVFTFQYKNWEWNWSATGPNVSVQVKLYETTNVIEYVYRQDAQAGNPLGSAGASIGICDAAATPTYISLNNAGTTPTASSTVFTTNIGTKPATGQIYRFTPPPPCNTVSNLPTTGTVVTNPTSICLSGNVSMTFTPGTTMPAVLGITYKWQSAPAAAGPYTDIPGAITTTPSYTTTTPISANTFFKCVMLCNTTNVVMTSSASNAVTVTNPGSVTGTPGTRCGPGVVTLSATQTIPANTIRWYAAATGGLPIGTGSPFTTNYIPTTTTFYVASESPSAPLTATLGTGTLTNGTTSQPSPFGNFWGSSHEQYLITANELIALGMSAGNITSIAFDLASGYASAPLQNFQISMGSTTATALATTSMISTGLTQVVTPNTYTPPNTTGFATIPFGAPFIWDGSSNVIVDVSFSNCSVCANNSTCATAFTLNGNVNQTSTAYAATHSEFGDNNCSIITYAPTATNGSLNNSIFNQRPNMRFATQPICSSPRVPVVASVTASPAVTITTPAVVCNGSISPVSITSSPATNYTSYAWTPNVTDLYTNAGATTPYVSGNAPNLFFKSTQVGNHVYYLYSSGATPAACAHADTVNIWVQPGNVTIKGQPDTICVSGATKLSLDTVSGYFPGSIQWQASTNGTTYSDIAGATNPIYTTQSLAFGQNTYYKAIIKAGNTVCQSPTKYVVIANPTILSAPDSFNCGPGSVTLTATTGGNGSAIWYADATSNTPIATGSPFITPPLTTTTTYYVTSSGGGTSGTPVLGAGALTSSTASVNPWCSGWGGTKSQYLIKASELSALGIPPGGKIISLGLNVVTGGATYPGFAISMKPTTSTALTTTYETGTAEVFAPTTVIPTAGLNTFTFTTPFIWDGTSNVLIQTCWSNATTNSTGNTVLCDNTTFVATHRGQSDSQTPANMCGLTSTSSVSTYSQRPQFTIGFNNKCESARETVIAHIYPKPTVDLGPDINLCLDAGQGVVLDAGVQPNGPQYLWDDNSTSQVRSVEGSGTYSVKVTNQYTCSNTDTVKVVIRPNPIVNLGNDTTVCNGVTLTLDAGPNGTEYFWSNGQHNQKTNVNSAGSYNVFKTNSLGCVKADTIVITMQGELPSIQGIQVTNDGQYHFQFAAVFPQNVIGYEWDFGDNTPHSFAEAPDHTYPDNGDYIVTLLLSSTCGFVQDTASAHIVGIHQVNVGKDEVTVYPNPTNEAATIVNKSNLKMEKIQIYNVIGQVVYTAKADSKDKHVLKLSGLASGTYTIEIFTDQGTVARKLDLVR